MTTQTTPTAWAHLPNAAHIDRILAHVKAHPERWIAARDDAWGTVWNTAWGTARNAAWNAAWDAARSTALGAAWDAAWGAARGAARDAARDALQALIVWDDCAHFLDMPADAVKVFVVSGHHPAVLLYTAVLALFKE